MKNIAIDTNTLLTFRLQREPHFPKAKILFTECLNNKTKIFLPTPVILETEWVLRSYYKESKDKIISFFQELLLMDNLYMREKKEVEVSLNTYKTSSGISFTDCLILTQIQNELVDDFLTFDENLKKFYNSTL